MHFISSKCSLFQIVDEPRAMAESDESWAGSEEQSEDSEEHSEDEGTSSDTDSEVKHLRFPYRGKRWPIGEFGETLVY